MWYKHSLRNVWRDFRLLMSALATVAGESFYVKFTRVFYVTTLYTDIESLKSLHTLIDEYLDNSW